MFIPDQDPGSGSCFFITHPGSRGQKGTGSWILNIVKISCVLPAYVMVQHLEILVSQPLLNVPLSASEVVVHHKYLNNLSKTK